MSLLYNVPRTKRNSKFVDGMGALTLIVERKEVDNLPQSNHADSEIHNYHYDIRVKNNYSLEHLKISANIFVEQFLKGEKL